MQARRTRCVPILSAISRLTMVASTKRNGEWEAFPGFRYRHGVFQSMVLYIIGLGLGDEKDITVKGDSVGSVCVVCTANLDLTCSLATGLEAIKQCDVIFLEHYTAILGVDKAKLVRPLCSTHVSSSVCLPQSVCCLALQEAFYGKSIELADREMVESEAHRILAPAAKGNAALLVVGDPFA